MFVKWSDEGLTIQDKMLLQNLCLLHSTKQEYLGNTNTAIQWRFFCCMLRSLWDIMPGDHKGYVSDTVSNCNIDLSSASPRDTQILSNTWCQNPLCKFRYYDSWARQVSH